MAHTCPYNCLAVLDLATAVCVGPRPQICNFKLEVGMGLRRRLKVMSEADFLGPLEICFMSKETGGEDTSEEAEEAMEVEEGLQGALEVPGIEALEEGMEVVERMAVEGEDAESNNCQSVQFHPFNGWVQQKKTCEADCIEQHADRFSEAVLNGSWQSLPQDVLSSAKWKSYEQQQGAKSALEDFLQRSGIGGNIHAFEEAVHRSPAKRCSNACLVLSESFCNAVHDTFASFVAAGSALVASMGKGVSDFQGLPEARRA
eukprot:1148604-Pelagomonas_calceolata.AAC.4